MLTDQRRNELLQIIEQKGFVSLHELADRVGVSESTVRRDLEYFDGIGQVRRTRGGAAFAGEVSGASNTFDDRHVANLARKKGIARYVADMLPDGEAVLLDGGTTTLEVARCLVSRRMQVITNSLPIANLLSSQPGIELILIGGCLDSRTGVALGPLSQSALSQIEVPRLVLSVGGITERGLFNGNMLLVETERRMIEAAGQTILAADHTKFGRTAIAPLCSMSSIQDVVTNSETPGIWREFAIGNGARWHTVD